jgi:hypothetical protein
MSRTGEIHVHPRSGPGLGLGKLAFSGCIPSSKKKEEEEGGVTPIQCCFYGSSKQPKEHRGQGTDRGAGA